jgi:hypothetical protein
MNNEHQETRSGTRPRSTGQDGALGSVSAKTQEAAEQVKHVALERAEQLRKSAQSVKTQAAERMRKFGSAVRWVGESLRHEDEAFVARYADTASQRIEDLASYIDSVSPQDMVDDVHAYARHKPVWFFGGALLLGLGAGRFLKSSAPAGSREPLGSAHEHDREPLSEQREPKETAERGHQAGDTVARDVGGTKAANGGGRADRAKDGPPKHEPQHAQRGGRERDGGAKR